MEGYQLESLEGYHCMLVSLYCDICADMGTARLVKSSKDVLFIWRFLTILFRAYPPEIIPLYIRSKAVSLATFFNWACNFALTFFTPPGFQNIQWKVSSCSQPFVQESFNLPQIYCVFGTLCFVAAIHVFFLFQETVGKSLEEIDEIFENQSIWAFNVRQEPSRLPADIEQAKEDISVGKVSVSLVQAPKP